MATKKLPIIHASTKYNSLGDNDFHARLIAVLNGTFDNPRFTLLPVDKPTFAAGVERHGTLLGLALDGSKKIIAERVQQRTTMAMYMRQLAHAVEIASAGNMETFLSSGFEPKAAARPISQLNPPMIKTIEQRKNMERDLALAIGVIHRTGGWNFLLVSGARLRQARFYRLERSLEPYVYLV